MPGRKQLVRQGAWGHRWRVLRLLTPPGGMGTQMHGGPCTHLAHATHPRAPPDVQQVGIHGEGGLVALGLQGWGSGALGCGASGRVGGADGRLEAHTC